MKAQRLLILVSLLICVGSATMATAMQDQPAAQPAQQQPAQPPAQQPPAAQPANPPAAQPAQPAPRSDVSVNVTRIEDTTAWYMNPFLIGLGVLALIVLVLLASRGESSSTTIVKD